MSKYDTSSIKTFDNEVVQQKLENQLITAMDMNQFITPDYSLAATPGMKIKIRTYHGNGDVEDVAMGAGNTGDIGAFYTEEEYEVGTTQGRVPYFDEQEMNDPTAIDKAIQYLSEQLTNDMTNKIVAEFQKGSNVAVKFSWDFAGVVDAIASMPDEKNEGLFMVINKKDYAKFQKNLGESLKYIEAFARSGYVGTVAGVPVYVTAAVPEGDAFLATKEAVTCFTKKGVTTESERDANTRKNTLYGRVVRVIALTNDNKVVRLVAKDWTYTAVVSPTGNPAEQGWFERSGSAAPYTYTATTDTTVQSGKTYYSRSIA